ncbi:cell division protein FtsL [Gayadomonas joobiniege]|uniref:cell division protein FtsL n=1 Tax=Gayadomonas joobiniege TaxID=1234606 RepID=UPI00035E5838|nr:cell division protein FtsL [Gayadomonas joobiniege]
MAQAGNKTEPQSNDRQPNLARLLLADLAKHWQIPVLLIGILASAHMVIDFAWKNRQLNSELQVLQEEKDKLDIDFRHMLLEHNALSEHNRIEQIAKDKLEMKRPLGKDEIIIKD